MKKSLEIDIYFYNGFDKPNIIARSIEELIKNVTIHDNYNGDMTQGLIDSVNEVHRDDIEGLNGVLSHYDMMINPSLDQLVDASMKWFTAASFPYHLLEDFGTRGEIYDIVNRTYDNFKTYYDHEGYYIVENYIRHKHIDTVIEAFNTLEAAEQFMDDNDLWDDATLLGVDHEGRAFYPIF